MIGRFALLVALLALASPALATVQVTVADLEKAVAGVHGKGDARAAKELAELQLTERLSAARLSRLQADLPGEHARLALLAVAGASAFLELPASDTRLTPVPDRATQDALLAKTIEYVKETIPRLPDFLATQQTIQFSNGPVKAARPGGNKPYDQRLHVVAESRATVRCLAGKEEVDEVHEERKDLPPGGMRLAVEGVFGPVFKVALRDALASSPVWSHWEVGSYGPVAVFRYRVSEEKSHYLVQDSTESGILAPITAYGGEVSLDPSTGAILRLSLVAVPRPASPVARADIVVEYGPVEIGGQTYICPLRSVALSLARNLNLMQDLYMFSQAPQQAIPVAYQLRLNDVEYAQYHLFRTEMHFRTDDGAAPVTNQPAAAPRLSSEPPDWRR